MYIYLENVFRLLGNNCHISLLPTADMNFRDATFVFVIVVYQLEYCAVIISFHDYIIWLVKYLQLFEHMLLHPTPQKFIYCINT